MKHSLLSHDLHNSVLSVLTVLRKYSMHNYIMSQWSHYTSYMIERIWLALLQFGAANNFLNTILYTCLEKSHLIPRLFF